MKNRFLLIIMLFSLNACSGIINNKPTEPTVTPLATEDQKLLSQAYLSLLLSVKLAEEAITRSTAMETKEYASAIIEDHKNMMVKLEEIAATHAAQLPLDISATQIKTWQQLVKERGIAFDKKFIETIQHEHEQALRLFASIGKIAIDSSLKQTGEGLVSAAARHQQIGLQLNESLNNRPTRDSTVYIHATSMNH